MSRTLLRHTCLWGSFPPILLFERTKLQEESRWFHTSSSSTTTTHGCWRPTCDIVTFEGTETRRHPLPDLCLGTIWRQSRICTNRPAGAQILPTESQNLVHVQPHGHLLPGDPFRLPRSINHVRRGILPNPNNNTNAHVPSFLPRPGPRPSCTRA